MEQNPDPQNIGWGIMAVFGILAGIGGFFRGIWRRARPDDPVVKAMQSDIAEMKEALPSIIKAVRALSEQHDSLHTNMERRVSKIERNGKSTS